MKKVFGYTRVSTIKQGNGVSLIEQREAIGRYAVRNNLEIVEWFEERETAAKQGRTLFSAMMKKLKKRMAIGVVIHKIDRSARNLRDWTDLGELADDGIEIHFAHESLDMQARSGRLSADIQAVIASDYIRNLRQETIKGLYGRLKQGIYPFQAPVGYRDTGPGRAKTKDPIQAPLVKKAFQLYASKKYSVNSLLPILHKLGLRNIHGEKLSFNTLSTMFHNTFYIGIIRVKGQSFRGIHEPLISTALFDKVQGVFTNRSNEKVRKHDLLFSKSITCGHCKLSLIGEVQKGHIYYRCHTKGCPTKSLRETYISTMLLRTFGTFQLSQEEETILHEMLAKSDKEWIAQKQELLRSAQLQLAGLNTKMDRLTDAYLEKLLDRDAFATKKETLMREIMQKEKSCEAISDEKERIVARVNKFLELSKSLQTSYNLAKPDKKSELLEIVTSNLLAIGKKLEISMVSPFYEMFFRNNLLSGSPGRDRTCDQTINSRLLYR